MLLSLIEFLILIRNPKAKLAKKTGKIQPEHLLLCLLYCTVLYCTVPVGVVLGGAAVSAAHADLPPGGQLHVRGPGLAPAAHSIVTLVTLNSNFGMAPLST